ncbi:hypothetical protein NC796_07995 [Aliifodinibius sp. S!AR15-10]|uniref:hypothetical protein n=1 Tax=Aliifodinibius sp. S!AR15-10 TaxID=2950437 RepID=UPI00285A6F30|nr:hypothetical protein [Aliifodinibius sp. S!AR15-10]MDR8391074.1 hypothetical protein [Aliifodinibius sp. S!AR15-10]
MRAIKAVFSWAYRYDLTNNNPFKGHGLLFEVKPNTTAGAFTKDEINRLRDHGHLPDLLYRHAPE